MDKLDKVCKSYIEYVVEHGKAPATFYAFAKKIKISESELYALYTSFEAIEMELWKRFFEEAYTTIVSDPIYQSYSVREKLLAFYYTWIEVLKNNRSFVVYSYKKFSHPILIHQPVELKLFKELLYRFANELLAEGKETQEIVPRLYLDKRYDDVIWGNTLFILHFWIKDTSKGFELTDTAIEKTVNTGMDIAGSTLFDSVFDLAKFIIQNK